MNADQAAGKWKQLKGAAKQEWAKLTDDDLEYIAGRVENLVGKLQERYGMAKEEAQKRVAAWLESQNNKQGETSKEHKAAQHTSHEPVKH